MENLPSRFQKLIFLDFSISKKKCDNFVIRLICVLAVFLVAAFLLYHISGMASFFQDYGFVRQATDAYAKL